ncbi:hypothetical protein CPAR01_13068 [Colletotrichum paranaense]|uniref:Uncharacterized protein n=1 Tax=Colletotrichum paranaense TaxID=1914294 RepID=A0ABQ9S5M4_9PEZI|nr:uncharacterized protein CPAR01_13068 [Colletotrichum paranaense]KAK1526540.1 hypothetical protein CPAR01_13068 [Colletotrichum paranaense]
MRRRGRHDRYLGRKEYRSLNFLASVIPIHGNSCKKLQRASAADAPALSLRCLPSPFNLAWKVQSVG